LRAAASAAGRSEGFAEACGNPVLGDALAAFLQRWTTSVQRVADDHDWLADRLSLSAAFYQSTDDQVLPTPALFRDTASASSLSHLTPNPAPQQAPTPVQ
jgi:hypothetical protein